MAGGKLNEFYKSNTSVVELVLGEDQPPVPVVELRIGGKRGEEVQLVGELGVELYCITCLARGERGINSSFFKLPLSIFRGTNNSDPITVLKRCLSESLDRRGSVSNF